MKRNSRSIVSPADSVKVEKNECDQDGGASCHPPKLQDQTSIREFTILVYKEELSCNGDSDALDSLYSGHEVKEEIVLGPESVQRPSIHYAKSRPLLPECYVRLERDPHIEARLARETTTSSGLGHVPGIKNTPRRRIRDILNSLLDDINVEEDTIDNDDIIKAEDAIVDTEDVTVNAENVTVIAKDVTANAENVTVNAENDTFDAEDVTVNAENVTFDAEDVPVNAEKDTIHAGTTYEANPGSKSEERDREKDIFCALCNRGFAKSRSMKHLLSHIFVPVTEKLGQVIFTMGCVDADLTNHDEDMAPIADMAADEGTASNSERQPTPSSNKKVSYSCDLCNKKFVKFATLKAHTRFHTGENPFPCEICGKTYTTEKALSNHKVFHTGELPYQCQFCGTKFAQIYQLGKHRLTHTRTVHCKICQKEIPKSIEKRHNRFHSSEHQCEICEKGFSNSASLGSHLFIHSPAKPFSCEVCSQTFTQAIRLKKHVRNVHEKQLKEQNAGGRVSREHEDRNNVAENVTADEASVNHNERRATSTRGTPIKKEKTSYSCTICNQKFTELDNLRAHTCVHSLHKVRKPRKKVACDICGRKLHNLRDLNKHKLIHTGERPYQCDVCEKKFRQKNSLARHIKAIHAMCESCDICGKTIPKCDMKTHMQFHLNVKHRCEICEKGFKCMTNLRDHLRIHSGEKPFSCEVCGRKFRYSNSLGRHMDQHTGKQRFSSELLKIHRKKQSQERLSCKVCKEEFTHPKYLKMHKRKHMPKKSYSCDICNKELASLSALQYHRQTHLTLKPYSCKICKREFRELSFLKTHERLHTGEKPYSCHICQKKFTRASTKSTHIQKSHKTHKELMHTCKICGKKIKKTSIETHERFHTGDKRNSCEICEKGFKSNWILREHLVIHSDELPFSCNICSQRFYTKSILIRHKKIHTKAVNRKVNTVESAMDIPLTPSEARSASPKSMFLELINKKRAAEE